jgi:hypothetical protein
MEELYDLNKKKMILQLFACILFVIHVLLLLWINSRTEVQFLKVPLNIKNFTEFLWKNRFQIIVAVNYQTFSECMKTFKMKNGNSIREHLERCDITVDRWSDENGRDPIHDDEPANFDDYLFEVEAERFMEKQSSVLKLPLIEEGWGHVDLP